MKEWNEWINKVLLRKGEITRAGWWFCLSNSCLHLPRGGDLS